MMEIGRPSLWIAVVTSSVVETAPANKASETNSTEELRVSLHDPMDLDFYRATADNGTKDYNTDLDADLKWQDQETLAEA